MPKSHKKKKEKASDFAKAKLKLGKGKKTAPNATDTSFKIRAINLPTQSLDGPRGEDEAVTRKNQTLAQVLSRMRHYSPNIRRESLLGLQELMVLPSVNSDHMLSQVFEALGRVTADEDAAVRKTLIETMKWAIHTIDQARFEPYLPLLLLHVQSNMAHIFPDIRVDAIRILHLLLKKAPSAVADYLAKTQSVRRGLEAFRSILQIRRSRGGGNALTPTSSVILTNPTKCEILDCLRSFISTLALWHSPQSPLWYLRSMFDTDESFHAFRCCLDVSTQPIVLWNEEDLLTAEDWLPYTPQPWAHSLSLSDVTRPTSDPQYLPTPVGTSSSAYHKEVLEDFTPALVDMVFDASRSVLSWESETDQNLLRIASIGLSTLVLIFSSVAHRNDGSGLFIAESVPYLQAALSKLGANFPNLMVHAVAHVDRVTLLEDCNRCYCGLVALYQLAYAGKPMPAEMSHNQRASDFATNWLGTKGLCTEQDYRAMIPIIWCALSAGSTALDLEVPPPLLTALLRHAKQIPTLSPLKTVAYEFIAQLLLLQGNHHYKGYLRISPSPDISDWLLSIPRLLWELGGKSNALTEKLLLFLLRGAQQRNILLLSVVAPLSKHLIPFFYYEHPTRGAQRGPCGLLPRRIQHLSCTMVTNHFSDAELLRVVRSFMPLSDNV